MAKISKHLQTCKFLAVYPKSKARKVKGTDWIKAVVGREDAEKILNSGSNIAIVCGEEAEKLFVVDDDHPNHEIARLMDGLPHTHTTKTKKGFHYYFYNNDQSSLTKRAAIFKNGDKHADVLTNKNAVVGAGSTHPDGGQYTTVRDLPIKAVSWAMDIRPVLEKAGFNIKGGEQEEQVTKIEPDNDVEIKGIDICDGKQFQIKTLIMQPCKGERNNAICTNVGAWMKNGYSEKNIKLFARSWYDQLNPEMQNGFPYSEVETALRSNISAHYADHKKARIKKIENATGANLKPKKVPLAIRLKNVTFETLKKEDWIKTDNGDYLFYNKKTETWMELTDEIAEGEILCEHLPPAIAYPKNAIIVLKRAKRELGETATINLEKEKLKSCINLLDCDINYKTGAITNARKENYLLHRIPFAYNEKATELSKKKNPINNDEIMIETISGQILGEKYKSLFFELLGYCLMKEEAKRTKMFYLHGDGGTGKSAYTRILQDCMGRISHLGLNQLIKEDAFGREALFGSFANFAAEIPYLKMMEMGIIKKLTGGDRITCARKYLPDLTFDNYAKLFFSMNEIPQSSDKTEGFFRRLILIEFNKNMLDLPGDQNLIYKLKNEDYEAAILKAVLTINQKKMWEKNWKFCCEGDEEKRLSKKRFITLSESLNTFIDEKIDITGCDEDYLPSCEVYDKYIAFCDDNKILEGTRIKSKLSFSKRIAKLLPETDRTLVRMDKYNRKPMRVRTGLTWKDDPVRNKEI